MELIMFSGNSLRNQEWIHQAEQELGVPFVATYVQDYRHWQTGAENIDLQHELAVLRDAATGFGESYGVFAKSIGTVLVAQALEQGIIKPRFLLLMGIPLGYIEQDYTQFADVLARQEMPITIVHNQNDVVGTSQAVQDYFAERLNGIKLVVSPGNTHDYEDYTLLRKELEELVTVSTK